MKNSEQKAKKFASVKTSTLSPFLRLQSQQMLTGALRFL